MDKMRMESLDLTTQNIEKIGALFPNCITETVDENGKPKKAINFDLLKQMLSGDVIDGSEAYEFTWVGKKAAIVEANKPIRKTLRPCKEESVNWDTTENLYIEGDNLEVLKLLQESYLGAIKLIYIDPPYNTGNDFVYKDDFHQNLNEYISDIGLNDDDGNRLFQNTESNGRFHSDWCSMIYSRLTLARNLLADDGVIFISIDDNEVKNLRNMGDEIFGEHNFVNHIIWHKKYGAANDAKYLSDVHDHILLYCKNKQLWSPNLFERPEELNAKYKNPDNDPRGPWIATNLSVKTYSKANDYIITSPAGLEFSPPPSRCWVVSKEKYEEMLADNRITFGSDGLSRPYKKTFLSEVQNGIVPTTLWSYDDAGHTIGAKSEIRELFSDTKAPFDTPKPTKLIKRIIEMSENQSKDDVILDFFGGSSTTADAVMQLNAKDGGKRKYILVQIDEKTQEKSVARMVGYETINQIGKERIRRAGKKIKEDNPLTTQNLDIGFRVLKLDDSNMNDVYYSANEYSQDMLSLFESNVKSDRTDLDLLFGCLLEWGLPLSLPYTSETIEGCTVHTYNDGDLIACFDENIPDSVIKTIAKRQPLRAVFRDSSFASSPSKINVGEIFKLLAPDTRVKVI